MLFFAFICVYVVQIVSVSFCISRSAMLFLLRLFMQELLREIILQPNYTVIMEMRGSCLETQTQNGNETMVCVCACVCSCRACWWCQINLYLRHANKLLILPDQVLCLLPLSSTLVFIISALLCSPHLSCSFSLLSSHPLVSSYSLFPDFLLHRVLPPTPFLLHWLDSSPLQII